MSQSRAWLCRRIQTLGQGETEHAAVVRERHWEKGTDTRGLFRWETFEEFSEAEEQINDSGEGDRGNEAMDDAGQAQANPTAVQEPIHQQEDPDQQSKSARSRRLQRFEDLKKSLFAEKSNDEMEVSKAGSDEVRKLRFPDAEEETPEDVRYKPCNGRDWNLWFKIGRWDWLGGGILTKEIAGVTVKRGRSHVGLRRHSKGEKPGSETFESPIDLKDDEQ